MAFKCFKYSCNAQISRNCQILESFAWRINKKRLLLNKNRNQSGRSCWIKPGRTNAWREKFLNNEVADTIQNGQKTLACRDPVFFLSGYNPAALSSKETDQDVKSNCNEISSGHFSLIHYSEEGPYRKNHKCCWRIWNFSLDFNSKSRKNYRWASLSKLIKLPKTVTEVETLTENFLNSHRFQCLGATMKHTYVLSNQERTILIA